MFPTYGPGSRVEAVLRNGRRVTIGAAPIALARVHHFLLRSARSGYEVVPVGHPRGAVASSVQVASQSAAPRAGRSLVIRVARGRIAGARFAARLGSGRGWRCGDKRGEAAGARDPRRLAGAGRARTPRSSATPARTRQLEPRCGSIRVPLDRAARRRDG